MEKEQNLEDITIEITDDRPVIPGQSLVDMDADAKEFYDNLMSLKIYMAKHDGKIPSIKTEDPEEKRLATWIMLIKTMYHSEDTLTSPNVDWRYYKGTGKKMILYKDYIDKLEELGISLESFSKEDGDTPKTM